MKDIEIGKLLGETLVLCSAQAGLASVELSSRYSVMNFSKDQDTLQAAANSLSSYIVISSIWSLGCILILWAQFGIYGAVTGFIFNIAMTSWIIVSYRKAFEKAAVKYNLDIPKLFVSII